MNYGENVPADDRLNFGGQINVKWALAFVVMIMSCISILPKIPALCIFINPSEVLPNKETANMGHDQLNRLMHGRCQFKKHSKLGAHMATQTQAVRKAADVSAIS